MEQKLYTKKPEIIHDLPTFTSPLPRLRCDSSRNGVYVLFFVNTSIDEFINVFPWDTFVSIVITLFLIVKLLYM